MNLWPAGLLVELEETDCEMEDSVGEGRKASANPDREFDSSPETSQVAHINTSVLQLSLIFPTFSLDLVRLTRLRCKEVLLRHKPDKTLDYFRRSRSTACASTC